ncbi:hypothetical protein C8Q80DRAFT_1222052 [Daedaleopsis nitida]|nr:hypothetical protein C8Q80DRAFT_1222052 [Daedaleopsis nitida]
MNDGLWYLWCGRVHTDNCKKSRGYRKPSSTNRPRLGRTWCSTSPVANLSRDLAPSLVLIPLHCTPQTAQYQKFGVCLPCQSVLVCEATFVKYDRLWTPYGLVRYGVDHPEVKNCTHTLDDAAIDSRLRFFGNINVGASSPIPHALLPYYTHILLSTGCTVPVLHSALPPSQYCVLAALSLVHRPSPPPLDRTSHVTLIGQGNVSLDVARMLLTPPDKLAKYDVPSSVIDVLRRSAVQHVSIVGRRGPLQAAFTTKELREMMNLPDASMVPLDPALFESTGNGSKNPASTTKKTWSLDFSRSPPASSLRPPQGQGPARETSTLSTDLVVTSLGHRAEPSAPWYDSALVHIRTVRGRVVGADGRVVRNVYASGWAAMGARGVLVSTTMDAYAVADTILRDHYPDAASEDVQTTALGDTKPVGDGDVEEVLPREVDMDTAPPEVVAGLKEGKVTRFEDWKKVDAEEIKKGEKLGTERERMGWEEVSMFLSTTHVL